MNGQVVDIPEESRDATDRGAARRTHPKNVGLRCRRFAAAARLRWGGGAAVALDAAPLGAGAQ